MASDKPGARALDRARARPGSPPRCSRVGGVSLTARRAMRPIAAWLREREVELVVLAGYMQLVSDALPGGLPRPGHQRPSGAAAGLPRAWRRSSRRSTTASRCSASPSTSSTAAWTPARSSSSGRSSSPSAATPTPSWSALHPIEHELLVEAVRLIARGAVRLRPRQPASSGHLTVESGRMDASAQPMSVPATASEEVQVQRALLSVSDKTGIVEFARGLAELGIEIISTGGTARAAHRRPASAVRSDLRPHRLSGDHGRPGQDAASQALRRAARACATTPSTCAAAEEHDVEFVDLVCVNLYPFERTAAQRGARDDEVIENIDIGGPTMIRAAAKNYAFAAPVVGPGSYDAVLAELRESDCRLSPDDPREPGRRGVRLHRALRHRDRPLVPGEARGLPAAVRARVREGARAALRREPPPARRLLRAGRRPHPRAVDGLPARRQADLVQQPARPRRRPAAAERVPDPGVRDHQAQQPLRRGRAARPRSRPTSKAFACDPDVGLRRDRVPEPRRRRRAGRGAVGAVRRGAVRPRLRRRRAVEVLAEKPNTADPR